jgi:hypothetical protein
MTVETILAKHFQPAGVLGGTSSGELERDLRRHARLNATIYALLLLLLVAILLGVALVIGADVRDQRNTRTALLTGAGVTFPIILELVRRAVREWSRASLVAVLCRGLKGPQLQSVIETLLDRRAQASRTT